jgi:hypothetical protein
MENEVDRRLLAEQACRFLAANNDRIRLFPEIVVGREANFGMTAPRHAPILESVCLFIIAVRKPFGVGYDIGGANTSSS